MEGDPPSPLSPPVPETFGVYEILRPGDTAGTWVARLRSSDGQAHSVMVHALDERDLEDGRLAARSAERLRLIQDRSHPAMVALLDVCRAGERIIAVTEHVPGADLAEVVEVAGSLSAEVVGSIAKEVCLALESLHGRAGGRAGASAVVHGQVDARAIRLARHGQVRLKCPVSSPVPVDGAPPPDVAGDLFELGRVLRSLVPPGSALSSVLARATTVHPQLRYPNAGAMRLALDQALRSIDPNQGPRERRRRSEAVHAQLAALVEQVLAQRGVEVDADVVPLDRHDFISGPGSLFIDVELGEGASVPGEAAEGGASRVVSHRRDRRTLEMPPAAELDHRAAHPAVELEHAGGHRAPFAARDRSTVEAPPSHHDTEETPALHAGLFGEVGTPHHAEVSDLLVVDVIPRPGEAPVPAASAAAEADHSAPVERLPTVAPHRPAYRSASRRLPLVASAPFRLLIVALAVLGALMICLAALLVDRGRRNAEAHFVPAAQWDVPGPSDPPPGSVSPL